MNEPYEPRVIHYPQAGYVEFVTQDVPTIARVQPGGFTVLLDMQTRRPVGWRFPDGSRVR